MKLTITHQESYSRADLLLRTFFGILYITIPHMFLMIFANIWAGILGFIAFWVILFTGRYPQSFFEFQVGMLRWSLRVQARSQNLVDGYPSFFPSGTDDKTSLDVPYPESLSRGTLLLKAFFGGIYCAFPHMFVLLFRMLWGNILGFVAWWVVLFTGKFPKSIHEYHTGTIRWMTRLNLYLGNMSDTYPPFSGRE